MAATAPSHHGADGIAVQVGAAHALTAVVAFGKHAKQGVVMFVRQRFERHGLAQAVEQRLLVPGLVAGLGDDLLGQHIQRGLWYLHFIQLAAAHAIEQRHALDQVVSRCREQPSFGHPVHLMPCTPHALQERCDRAG